MIDHLIAIVPAHNEEAEIIGCLTALVAAAEHAQTGEPAQADEQAQAGKAGSGAVTSRPPAVRIVAIADDCSDSTAGLIRGFAARHPLVTPMVVPFGNVGRARDAAAHAALRTIAEADPGALAATWLAFTDADSRVPVNWLTAHRDHALRGADCVVGTVEPCRTPGTGALVDAWFAGHSLGEGHEHVFGANLGIRGSLFTRIGGCPPLRLGEDAALVAAAAEAGGTIHRTDDCRVVTSARMHGRCHGGFSAYLRGLVAESGSDRLGEDPVDDLRTG